MRNGTWALLTATLVLGACNFVPTKPCAGDQDCGDGAFCDQETKTCVLRERCEPECAGHLQCVQGACEARYSALEIVKPSNGRAGENTVIEARLVPAPGREVANVPQSLPFEATPMDGGTVETGNLIHAAGGNFKGTWQPTAERRYRLTVRYADAGKEQTVEVDADKTKPTLKIVVPVRSLPTRLQDPESAWQNAYKRHEQPKIYVTSSSPDVDVSSLRFEVRGTSAVSMTSGSMVAVDATTCPEAAVLCAEFAPTLWEPEMNALRSNFSVLITGTDTAGNPALAAPGSIPVSRVRWSHGTSASITGTPAIGSTGRVYLGVSLNASSGSLHAIDPDGTTPAGWPTALGAVRGSAAVGEPKDGDELVFVAAKNASGARLVAVRGSTAAVDAECTTPLLGDARTSIALLTTSKGGQTIETAVTVVSQGTGTLHGLRPGAQFPTDLCPTDEIAVQSDIDGNVVTNGSDVFVGDVNGAVSKFFYTSGNWEKSFVAPIDVSPVALPGLAIVQNRILTGTSSALVGVVSDGSVTWTLPVSSTVSAPIVDSSGAVFLTDEPRIHVAGIAESSSQSQAVLASSVAPLAGADGRIYSVSANGTLQVWPTGVSGAPVWQGRIASGVSAVTAPNIDCGRDANGYSGGVLYFGDDNGMLYAIDVDSRGINVNAPWPRFQHDPRNTGNSSTDLSKFVCP